MFSRISAFIHESLYELRHVVFPTPNETRKYFTVVVGCIVFFAVFLFVAGTLFSLGLTSARTALHPIIGQTVAPISSDNGGVQVNQDAIEKFKARTASGASASGTANTGSTSSTTETLGTGAAVTVSTGSVIPTVSTGTTQVSSGSTK